MNFTSIQMHLSSCHTSPNFCFLTPLMLPPSDRRQDNYIPFSRREVPLYIHVFRQCLPSRPSAITDVSPLLGNTRFRPLPQILSIQHNPACPAYEHEIENNRRSPERYQRAAPSCNRCTCHGRLLSLQQPQYLASFSVPLTTFAPLVIPLCN